MRLPLVALLAAALYIAYADQIHLKDGRVLKGKVVYEDEGKVVLEAEYGKVTIYKENIEKIVRGEEAAPSPQKKREATTDIVRAFAAGDDTVLAELKEREDAVWVAKRLLRKEKEQARKVRLEALIRDLTRADPEDMEAAEKLYKKGLMLEKEWRGKYEALRKSGKSHKEAVKATARELAEAIRVLQEALERWRYHEPARLHLGVLFYQARLLKEAVKVLDVLVLADVAEARRAVGACYFLLGRFEKALKALDDLSDTTALEMRQQCLLRLKRFRQALALAKKMQKKEPDNPKGVGYEGMALLGLGKFKKAAERLRRAYEAGERSRATVYSLATALARTKSERDLREAEKLLRHILKDDPAYVPAVYELVRILLKQKRRGEARDVVEKALSLVDKGSKAGKLLKRLLAELKK